MEIKILQVFYGKDGLPYKDKDRQVHFPITGTGFLGASKTTQIKFYYDELDNLDETTWVAVSKLPNGKIGSRVLESHLDSELNEHYALLELDNYYTQYKGDVFISLQGYQGGVDFDYDEENSQYEIHGTPTIAATGSIKFTINYANQFVGSGQADNVTLQRILADLGTKLGIRARSEHVEELPTVGESDVFYVINNDLNDPNKQNIYIWNAISEHYVWVGDNSLDLGDYYTQEQGDAFEDDIERRVLDVESELSSVAQGSPKGVYATLSALQAAFPTGASGIYLVQSDGHWYYWNGSAWTDGGLYLATNNEPNYYKTLNTELPSTITDLDNFPANSSYSVTSAKTEQQLAHCPFYSFQGGIIDFTVRVTSNQIRLQLVFFSDKVYYRMKWAAWGNWKLIERNEDIQELSQYLFIVKTGGIPSGLTDLNDCPYNIAFAITGGVSQSQLANCPVYPFYGAIRDLTVGVLANNVRLQIAQGSDNKIFIRSTWATGQWTDWKEIVTDFSNVVTAAGNFPYSTVNDLNDGSLTNKLYRLTTARTEDQLAHAPFYPVQGNIFTFSGIKNGSQCVTQFLHFDETLYYRIKWAAWGSWYKIPKPSEIATVSKLDISVFTKIGVVGDSYASGELYNSTPTILGDFYDVSWLQIMARKNGFTGYNFSRGGQTTTGFLTDNNYGLPKLLSSPKCGLYLLCLGLNDRNYTTLGTIEDINDSDPSQNPNTFYGNYGKIISAIMNYSSGSKLIMFTMASNNNVDTFNAAIREIAQHYGIPCIETMSNAYFNSQWYANNLFGGHPTTPVYAMMSKQYQKMIEDCIYDNVTYFRDYTGQDLD